MHTKRPERVSSPLVVVHVAESFASGVAAAARDYVRNYPAADHHLLYSEREDAPLAPDMFEGFSSTAPLGKGFVQRLRRIRHAVKSSGAEVVHAHSSQAGLLTRLAINRRKHRVVYTPHCFGFERLDLGRVTSMSIWAVEKVLAKRTSIIAGCSPREVELAKRLSRNLQSVYVPNVAGRSSTVQRRERRNIVVAVGRTGPQKDPGQFAAIARMARDASDDLTFIWVGRRSSPWVEELEEAGVQVTGWLGPLEVRTLLETALIYVHTAAWEGFPLGILEANAARLPCLVRAAPYALGLPQSALFDSPTDAMRKIHELADSEALRDRNITLVDDALAVNTAEHQRAALTLIYGKADANF